jgi:ABC-2 type transport system ATP-binding protein
VSVAALCGVSKAFGSIHALEHVDLHLDPGEVVALLGRNGAGKTTALSILVGLRRPDTGRACLFGRDPRRPAARARVGAMPQESAFPLGLRVREVVDLVRRHYPAPEPAERLLERFELVDVARRLVGGVSPGGRRRLALALAFAGRPDAVFLDEPSAGLDVEARRRAWSAVEEFAADGGSVLLTTHYLEEAERLATRVVVLRDGHVAAEGTASELKRRAGIAAGARLEDAVLALLDGDAA